MTELTRELIIERLVERRIELVAENGERALEAIFRNGALGYDDLPINQLLDEYQERSLHEVYSDDEDELASLRKPMTTEQYVETGGTRCPFCRGQESEGGPVEFDAGYALQKIECNTCGRAWRDVYTLTKYEGSP